MRYDELLPYCITEEEKEKIEAIIETGSQGQAIKKLHCHARTLEKSLKRIRDRKEKQDKGISVYYRSDGGNNGQWIKGRYNSDQTQKLAEAIVKALSIPKFKPVKPPKVQDSERLNAYIFGDSHVDMLAWLDEVGASWDLDIAEQHHISAMCDLIDRSPKCNEAILATMGDLFHRDSLKAITPNGGNLVDVDGRLARSWERGVAMIRAMIDKMLKKYQKVYYLCLRGNHSPTLELVLASTIRIAYENEPRIEVLSNIPKHIPFQFGNNFMLFTHGDGLSDQKKADLAVGTFREFHGKAKFTHVLTGHLHHAYQKELSGALVEIFQVLPTPDAWHYEGGWATADQAASVLTYHKNGGIINRTSTNPRIYLK